MQQRTTRPESTEESNPEQSTSYAEALKSTSIMGGSTALVMLIRMVRTKVLALLLGPAGVGLEAMYDSIITLTRTTVDLGISTSGVRQIAAAAGTGDQRVIATTVITLRRVCLILGTVGAIVLFLARVPISHFVFGHTGHAREIAWLAIIPLLGGVAGGQGALLQGMRRIGDLAKLNILGAVAAAFLSIPVVWLCGKDGIPAYLVLSAVAGLVASWSYVRRLNIRRITVSFRETILEAKGLLRLGVVFLLSGLMMTCAIFVLRVFVTRQWGIDGAGQFQAANALSMVYVGFVLQAMGSDFYPRLTAAAEDNLRCNRLVNEQTEISNLLALPGILATIAIAPWVIRFFYSGKFAESAEILCWQVAGMFFRVNSWPMGFIMLAKGRGRVIFCTELAAYSVYISLGWWALRQFGLPGAGMAFLGLYVFHCTMLYAVVSQMSGFRWSRQNTKLTGLGAVSIAIALWGRLAFPEPWSTLVGCILAVVLGAYCAWNLIHLVGTERVYRLRDKARLAIWNRGGRRYASKTQPSIAG